MGFEVQREAEGDPRLGLVPRGPGDPARQGERGCGMVRVRSCAAPGERPPQSKGGVRLRGFHPFGGAVACHAVLEAEDDRRGLVVGEEPVVPPVRACGIVDPRRGAELLKCRTGQGECSLPDALAVTVVEHAGHQFGAGRVEGDLVFTIP
ncbi:hypothetical protein BGM09_14290 [Streptomyces sp. CBMA29]|nr:hypothetical protein [Streptomyces sp. CBMA29]